VTDPNDSGSPIEGVVFDGPTPGEDASAEDAINTESVNDGEEVAPAPAGAAPAGGGGRSHGIRLRREHGCGCRCAAP
jgi:hypothetical protein